MTGVVEEVGKTTVSFIDALKREPLSLALVLMNLALLVFFYFILNAVALQREREVSLLYKDKAEVQHMLSRCIIPDRQSFSPVLPLPKLPTIKQLVEGD